MKSKKQSKIGLLWELSYGSRFLYLVGIICMVVVVLCNYITPQIISFTVDSVLGSEPISLGWLDSIVTKLGGTQALIDKIWIIGGCVLVVALFGGVCNFFRGRTIAMASEGIVKRLRDRLFNHTQHMPYSWHVEVQTGDIIQRCTSDVEMIRNFAQNQLIEILRTVFLVTSAYIILFQMNFAMAAASFVFLPFMFGYSFFFLRGVSTRFQRADEAEGLLMAMAQENFTGVRVVRAFGRERYEVERFDKQNHHYSNLWMHLGKLLSYFWGVGDVISVFQIIATCVFGAIEAKNGNITVGGFMVFLIYNSMTIWPVRGLGKTLSDMSKAGVSIARLQEILHSKVEEDDKNATSSPIDGDIVFDHVSFSYGQHKVLDDVSFTIKKGETLGILGSTGSGKTTLVHLLCRLYDLKDGKITIGGKPIESFQRKWLRKHVGIVLQEPFLFSRTIQENIAALSKNHTLDEIRSAAKIANVDESIMGFSAGYDTVVGERGVTLSGGQKQRVAIARTIIKQPPIMIFDDSLSAVDTQTDAQIRDALAKHTVDNTTILIAYRITSLSRADKIIVLDNGRIVESGTHEELMAQGGTYRQVHDMQESIVSD